MLNTTLKSAKLNIVKKMIDRFNKIKKHFKDLETKLSDPETLKDPLKYKKISQERASLEYTAKIIEEFEKNEKEIKETEELLRDPLMKEEAENELLKLKTTKKELDQKLKVVLIPKDPSDPKDVIMEIRAGAGGDEAGLFVADLFRMYSRYAEIKGWKTAVLSSHRTGIGGFKEIIFEIKGENVFSKLKYEKGVHRVQRIPETEKSGRIHTSTATVAVLPVAEDIDYEIKTEDLRIDRFRSGGAGGQHVNKTESAIRITYLPTNTVVSCQDEKSQFKNKEKAMRILKSRLGALDEEKKAKEATDIRRSQIGTGDRSEKIRTYNFPQDRMTDHRIKFTLKNLPGILDGNLDLLFSKLSREDQEIKMQKSQN